MISSRLIDFVFFGTDEFAAATLEELAALNCRPALIITTPDKPRGRGRRLAPPPVKLWAETHQIPYLQPKNLRSDLGRNSKSYKLFLVASYGQILPPEILSRPERGVLNIHPSLLPKFRGPTPIQSAIMAGEEQTGVTIMLVDKQIDHGPILKAQGLKLKRQNFVELRDQLARLGARLLIEILPAWLAGKITPRPQNHAQATYTKKIKKDDGLIDLAADDRLNYRKFLALNPWPGIYFFTERGSQSIRVIITAAHLDSTGRFVIDRVKLESRREMTWADFQRGFKK